MRIHNITDWYYAIGEDTANVWSSKRAKSVPVMDEEYVAWLVGYGNPTPMATMQDLQEMFAVNFPPGTLETYCTYVRWLKESGGMTLMSGMKIRTDDRAKARINAVTLAAGANAQFTTMWHSANNEVHQLDKAKILAMSNELNAFVDDAFAISADTLSKIKAGTITTHQQIDDAFGISMQALNANLNYLARVMR